jgi:hypothetical protein
MGHIVLSVAIMTHATRFWQAAGLRDRHPELNAIVVTDTAGSPLGCAQAAWRAMAPDATHHLVLQDDVELCEGFLDAVLEAIALRPGDALALFTEWGSRTAQLSRIAALRGAAWAEVVDEYVPSLALVLPAETARRFGRFAAREGVVADDVAMRAFLDELEMPAYARVPNLVEHQDAPSIVGNDEMGERRSVCYFAQAFSTGPATVAGLGVVPHFSWWEGRSVCCVRTDATWRKVATRELLTGRGIDAGAAVAELRPLAAGAAVSEILLSGLCLTAFAIGMIAGPGDMSVVTDRALGTLAGGGLRRFVPRVALADVSGRLKPMVASAVLAGSTYWSGEPQVVPISGAGHAW